MIRYSNLYALYREREHVAGHLRALVAEIINDYEASVRFDLTPELEARFAQWRRRAGIEAVPFDDNDDYDLLEVAREDGDWDDCEPAL